MTPKLLSAFSQNGAALPNAPMMTPPSAGPIARPMLTPTPLLATAAARSRLGTRLGTTDCHAGAVNAAPAPRLTRALGTEVLSRGSILRAGTTQVSPTSRTGMAIVGCCRNGDTAIRREFRDEPSLCAQVPRPKRPHHSKERPLTLADGRYFLISRCTRRARRHLTS